MLQCEDSAGQWTGQDLLHTGCHQPPLTSDLSLTHPVSAPQTDPPAPPSDLLTPAPPTFPHGTHQPQNPVPNGQLNHDVNSNEHAARRPSNDRSSAHLSPPEGVDNTQSIPHSLPPPPDLGDTQGGGALGVPVVDLPDDVHLKEVDDEENQQDVPDVLVNGSSVDSQEGTGSDTCLLKEDSGSEDNPQSGDPPQDQASVQAKAPGSYTNRLFSMEGKTHPASLSPPDQQNGADVSSPGTVEDRKQHEPGARSAEEPEEDEETDDERTPLHKGTGLESLVQQLAEHHPSEMVSITVDVLDGPAEKPKPESLQALQKSRPASLGTPPVRGGFLYSSESLNAYKLSKQGHPHANNNLHLHAVNNSRSKTMDNIHIRSSFRNLASTSVSNLGEVCRKAMSYLRTDMEFSSMMSLGKSEKQPSMLTVGEGEGEGDEDSSGQEAGHKGLPSVPTGRHMRNLLYMSLLITIFFVASYATRNLQSSLNQDGAIGVTCLAVMFLFYILGSILSPVLVQGLGVRRCILGGLVCQLFYVGVNLYPVMWTMVPASMGGGASLALIWNAMSTYIVLLARGESRITDKPYERLSDKYFGIFCLIYQSNLIVGNLISALVLSYGDTSSSSESGGGVAHNSTAANRSLLHVDSMASDNVSRYHLPADHGVLNDSGVSVTLNVSQGSPYDICGADFCHHYVISKGGGSSVTQLTKFLLFGIFMLMIVICMLIGIFLLEPLSAHLFTSTGSPWRRVKNQVVALGKFSCNKKFLLLLPLMLYSVMQYSFVSSEVTVAFMTCPIGVFMVGYCMMSYGANCSIGSYVCQALAPRIGRGFFVALAFAINMALLVCMRFWKPYPESIVPVLIIASLFGFADGIWNVSANALCGSVFPDHFEEAFTGLRVAQGIGGSFNMAYSPFFCLTVKLYVMMGVVSVVFLGYVGAELLIRKEKRQREAGVVFVKEVSGDTVS